MTDTITFRSINMDDIPMMHRWRNQPHVSQWWQPAHPDMDYIREEVAEYMKPNFGVKAYIARYAGHDFAYIQQWQVAQFPDYRPFVPLDDLTTGIDVFIGLVEYLHKGLGTLLIRQFIREHVFDNPHVPDCIIDPLPENKAAIRAYEKVGFRHEKTFTYKGSRVYFMRLKRNDFE